MIDFLLIYSSGKNEENTPNISSPAAPHARQPLTRRSPEPNLTERVKTKTGIKNKKRNVVSEEMKSSVRASSKLKTHKSQQQNYRRADRDDHRLIKRQS